MNSECLNLGIKLTVHKAGVDDPLIYFICTRECHFVRLRFTVPSLGEIKAASKKWNQSKAIILGKACKVTILSSCSTAQKHDSKKI